jgi:vacuolar-type H+-ATPase subunit B/Vma2
LDIAWELLRTFPKEMLSKIPDGILKGYYERKMFGEEQAKEPAPKH